MEANHTSEISSESPVLDCATLYLCRQGRTWVVVVESPSFTGALLLRHAGSDSFDARYELLSGPGVPGPVRPSPPRTVRLRVPITSGASTCVPSKRPPEISAWRCAVSCPTVVHAINAGSPGDRPRATAATAGSLRSRAVPSISETALQGAYPSAHVISAARRGLRLSRSFGTSRGVHRCSRSTRCAWCSGCPRWRASRRTSADGS